MRRPFIAGNWKMFKTVHEAVVYIKEFRGLVKDIEDVEIVVAPPFTALHASAEAARNTTIGVAAQDLHWERECAFTGESSGPMIKEAGAEYVIIGHSERRTLFGETDESVNRKIGAAIAAGLVPIVCIGHTLDARTTSLPCSRMSRGGRSGAATRSMSAAIAAIPISRHGCLSVVRGTGSSPAYSASSIPTSRRSDGTRYPRSITVRMRRPA